MKYIYDLVRINKNNQKVVNAFVPKAKSNPLRKLMTLTYNQTGLTDHECMISIYGRVNKTAFSELKRKYYEILINVTIIQNDLLGQNEKKPSILFHTTRQLLAARILLTEIGNVTGIKILEKAIKKSIQFDLSENVLTQSLVMIRNNSSIVGNDKVFYKYKELYFKYHNIFTWESMAELYYFELKQHQYVSLGNAPNSLIIKSIEYSSKLDTIAGISTVKFIFNKYRVKAQMFEYLKDYKGLLLISETTIKEFDDRQDVLTLQRNSIYVRKIYALIQTNCLSDAIKFGESILPKINLDVNNWFRIKFYLIKALYYNAQYSEGLSHLFDMMETKGIQRYNKIIAEIFPILIGYSKILSHSNKFLSHSNNFLTNFKVGKFLNEIPVFSKDKHGINVSILLLHITLLLLLEDYIKIIDRTESLKQYVYRHLRRDDSFRSNCMIKMVIQMAKADFHPVRTERYTKDLLKKLQSVPLAGSGENIEIEFLPFEVLWEIMMNAIRPEKDRKPLSPA